ncbi:hypothetical protein ASPWEDRAFT_225587 [Aspergillus wentii DTO 134E9]|uniref:Methyltransferase type 12 domain-containing protein n=1 Tax=Aspergillus wentii DTO 134E9 TaxID=1073089 RepID=A0A1L9S0H3_ASPWE|nr:uncharacterized protein ASPWEDRAFT_225587 [Aspergillus wentii DTO 134E9]OJJ40653.1 hypothetical protein ASPWEDRAFT_225587 [Aspergillus wentii DTO 134E9]
MHRNYRDQRQTRFSIPSIIFVPNLALSPTVQHGSKKNKPNDVYVYSFPYLVDYYDIVAPNSKSVDDASFYWRVYNELKALRAPFPADPFIVMDVGTGTGRVLHGLEASAIEAGADLVDTEFLGVDNAPHMLDKARQITTGLLQNRVSWVLGSALDLEATIAGRGDLKVGLLIFSIGSISHLSEDRQPETFLEEVSKILRPGTGRASVWCIER